MKYSRKKVINRSGEFGVIISNYPYHIVKDDELTVLYDNELTERLENIKNLKMKRIIDIRADFDECGCGDGKYCCSYVKFTFTESLVKCTRYTEERYLKLEDGFKPKRIYPFCKQEREESKNEVVLSDRSGGGQVH